MKSKLLLFSTCLFFIACNKDELPSYTLSVTAGDGGAVSPAKKVYNQGQNATMTATPDEFYEFTGWTGDITSQENPHTLKMNSDMNVVANFSKRDSDGDGVTDDMDNCPNTEVGTSVDDKGCPVNVYVDSNGVTVKAYEYAEPGDKGLINGKVYTVVDEATLRTMVQENKNVSQVVTSLVEDMSFLFFQKSSFDQDISSWDVSGVTNMREMFTSARVFNANLSNWDVGKVINMQAMFQGAESFDQNISEWNVGNVTDMAHMFLGATAFDQNLGGWDVSKVISMYRMFGNATSFNQDLSNWEVSNVVDCGYFTLGASSWTLPKPGFTNCTP